VADGALALNRFPKPWSTLKQFLTVRDVLLRELSKGLNLKIKFSHPEFAHLQWDISTLL
jgi:hypothetical protein